MHMTSQKGAPACCGSNEALPRAPSPSMQPAGQPMHAIPPRAGPGPRTDCGAQAESANALCQHNTCAQHDKSWPPTWRRCYGDVTQCICLFRTLKSSTKDICEQPGKLAKGFRIHRDNDFFFFFFFFFFMLGNQNKIVKWWKNKETMEGDQPVQSHSWRWNLICFVIFVPHTCWKKWKMMAHQRRDIYLFTMAILILLWQKKKIKLYVKLTQDKIVSTICRVLFMFLTIAKHSIHEDLSYSSIILILQSTYLYTRDNDKTAVLLHLLRDVIQPNQLTVVFLATRHHVEYVREVTEKLLLFFQYWALNSPMNIFAVSSLWNW